MDEGLINEMLSRDVWAVLGVSRDREKYGYKIFRKLRDKGYTVYAINPRMGEVDGEKCYSDLEELPEVPDVVNCVVPPLVTEEAVEKCKALGVPYIWMQPGSVSSQAVMVAEQSGIQVIHNACVFSLAV